MSQVIPSNLPVQRHENVEIGWSSTCFRHHSPISLYSSQCPTLPSASLASHSSADSSSQDPTSAQAGKCELCRLQSAIDLGAPDRFSRFRVLGSAKEIT